MCYSQEAPFKFSGPKILTTKTGLAISHTSERRKLQKTKRDIAK
jgi:hypothetical protein